MFCADTMEQGTGDSTQGQSAPLTDDAIKLELPWSVKEEPQDEHSAVFSTVQPMSDTDSKSGSLPPLNASHAWQHRHACPHCSAVFMLTSSLQIHLETFHGGMLKTELPEPLKLHDSAHENTTDKKPSGQEIVATQVKNESRDDCATSSNVLVIKLEPPWSMKEEQEDQPSSTVQPMSDNTSGSLLSLNASHVCQRCSATFVLFSSLELHMVTFHGEALHDSFPMYSTYKCYSDGYHHGSKAEDTGNLTNSKKAVEEWKGKIEDSDTTDGTDLEKKSEGPAIYAIHRKVFITKNDTVSVQRDKCVQTGQKRFACNVCGKDFTRRENLRTHKWIHTGQKPFVCDICNKSFTRAMYLRVHKLTHGGNKPFICDMCNKAFTRLDHLKRHKRINCRQKAYVCDMCNKTFTRRGHLKMNHCSQKAPVCNACSEVFTTTSGLKQHKRISISRSRRSLIECDECSKAFTSASQLKRHKLFHSDPKPFVCDVCYKRFTRVGHLKTHKLIHTGQRSFVCDVCSKAFGQAGHLKQHKLIHQGHKPFVCHICSKGFIRSSAIKRHMLTHTGDKSFVCNVCCKAFAQACHLKEHRLIHSDRKSFVCDVCSRAFTYSATLKQHKMIHSGQKPFQCDVCKKTFIQSSNFKRHQKRHTDKRTYQCPHSDTCSNDSDHLQKRKRSVHAGHGLKCGICK